MTDKELLELAAKAAGIKFADYGYCVNEGLWVEFTLAERKLNGICDPTGWHWNPLEDDGDALRLAVKLGINIQCKESGGGYVSAEKYVSYVESAKPNKDAAIRRVIVRVAAEIGMAIKSITRP